MFYTNTKAVRQDLKPTKRKKAHEQKKNNFHCKPV